MKTKRLFLMVMDSFGIGGAKDAARFGDEGSNTLQALCQTEGFSAPTLGSLGLFHIDGVDHTFANSEPIGAYARICEQSEGKDSTIGHWELAGIRSDEPLPTYPNGFPDDIIKELEKQTGRKVLCNQAYSGTEVIKDYGFRQQETGGLIIYTSVDSVMQIAAHTDVIPLEELYRCCEIARKILSGEHCVGRVIARPFTGEYPYRRTSDRHDYSALPPKTTVLDLMKHHGLETIAVGKINDIFAGVGISEAIRSGSNDEGMQVMSSLLERDFHGLCFVNFVDFDTVFGHRRNTEGYAEAVMRLDAWLKGFIRGLREDDILMITADHGCDPDYKGTDHTRENVPLLAYGKSIKPVNIGERESFSDIAATIADLFDIPYNLNGESFKEVILK
ncbi:MAG: phosphopentomutase [Ruminococcaceae bacterium]|nr:phosphopentomutase [Oscillospiraceae bacterium]